VPEPLFVPPPEPTAVDTAEERRGAPRYRCGHGAAVRVVVRPAFRCHRATLRDISLGGAGLHLWVQVRPGATLLLQLPGGTPDGPHARLARVVRVQAQSGYGFRVGCRFDRALTEDELAAVRAQLAATP
jgi:hypothetical protein